MINTKEIIVNNLIFKFQFYDHENLWYLSRNALDLFQLGYTTDITIQEREPDWDNVFDFLEFILSIKETFEEKIERSNYKLKELFKKKFDRLLESMSSEDVSFLLRNIEYKSLNYDNGEFEYELQFDIESKKDPDFFMYDIWAVVFKGNEIKEVKNIAG